MSLQEESRRVDSSLYDKQYFEATDGARYFFEGKVAPKFLRAVRISGLKAGDKVLDVGCGRGDLVFALARFGADVAGLDYSKDALEIARQAIVRLPPEIQCKIDLMNGDAAQLDFPDGTFDYVFMMDIVEHLYPEQLRQCFNECGRVLKNGGSLVVHTSPNRWYNDVGYPFWERPVNKILNRLFGQNLLDRPIRTDMDHAVHINEQTVVSLKKYLDEAGFCSKIWLGNEYILPARKDSVVMQALEVFRQTVCHLFPVSLVPPLIYIFSNNIWALGKKTS